MTEQRKTKRRANKNLPRYLAPIVIHLKEARLRQNISQSELEHRIGLGEGYLSKWETGERKPSLFNLFCWATSLGLQIDVIPLQSYAINDNGERIANDNLQEERNSKYEFPHYFLE